MNFGQILYVLGTACLPVVELKGAIAAGRIMELPLWETFLVAYIGSILPVPFILRFTQPLMARLRQTKPLKRAAHWVEDRTMRKSMTIRKYSLVGLFIFVAIPLPTTGVWSGALIASFLGLKLWPSFIVIVLGNIIAGLLVLTISYGVF
mgnify:CR=1 FL=1